MATPVAFEVEVQDLPYQELAGTPWLARLYRPLGPGPFPTLVGVHGGAWTSGDRTNNAGLYHALATRGVLTAAIDFRQPPEAAYPASVCDLNLAIRWLKVHATALGGTANVGALGVSSGGHLVLLSGLRPRDPRYASSPLAGHSEVDARLAYVVACWPVSDPLYRYRAVAKRTSNAQLVQSHEAYWGTDAAMAEGSPPLILERGEPVDLPPALVIQRTTDDNHPLEMQERLVQRYQQRGGQMEMRLFEQLPARFSLDPAYPDTLRVLEAISDFIRQHG
jgi:acetyl esterase/lipase